MHKNNGAFTEQGVTAINPICYDLHMYKNTAIAAQEKNSNALVRPHMTQPEIKRHADLSTSNGIKRVIFKHADTLSIWRFRIAALK